MGKILVTRPQSLNSALAARLQAAGYDTLSAPMLAIRPTKTARPHLDAQAVMITSAQTFHHIAREWVEDLLGLPCFCVGDKTAERARAFGFTNVTSGGGDVRQLAAIVAQKVAAGSILLHICGTDLTDDASMLTAAKASIIRWPVYRAIAVSKLDAKLAAALQAGEIAVALFYSARTAKSFVRLITRHQLESCCASVTAIGLSAAVTAPLAALSWQDCFIAPMPNEDAMLDCLARAWPTP